MADFKISRFKYTWKGEWQAGRRYNRDDVVSFGSKIYASLEPHVANQDFYVDLEFFNTDIPPVAEPRWEVMAEGVSWLGPWEPDYYYKVGDAVRVSGTIYICVDAHTSASSESAFITQTAFWTIQLAAIKWQDTWTVSQVYNVGDVVRYGGKIYRCILGHQSANSIDDGLEVNQAEWTEVSVSEDWKGDWTVNTKYKVNDIVKYGGILYKCDVGHESAGSGLAGLAADLGKWSVFNDGVQFLGAFVLDTIYKPNDVVKYGSYLYICNTFHQASVFDPLKWTIYCPGQEYDNTWNTTVVYQTGDIVKYGGNLYVSNDFQAANNPATSSQWTLLFENSRIVGDWDRYHSYLIGDVVRRGGNLYIAKTDSLNQDPDFLDDGSTTNEEYWKLIIPGIRWRGVWELGSTYIVGDTVVWIGSSYRCLDKHVATNLNRPDDDPEDGSTLQGRYWAPIVEGNVSNRMKLVGDLKTFGPTEDGSTTGLTSLEISTQGKALTVYNGEPSWQYMMDNASVYYVAEFGEDIPTSGTSPQNPWRTVRYALENVTGVATIFVRTGIYEEILPLRVPAFVSLVGDELRSTVIKPSPTVFTTTYVARILAAAEYIKDISTFIIQEEAIGTDDEGSPAFGTVLRGDVSQDFSGTAVGNDEALIINSLLNQFIDRLGTQNQASLSSTNSFTLNAGRLNARTQMINNRAFIKNETLLYLETYFEDSALNPADVPVSYERDLDRILDAVIYDIGYIGNYSTITAANYFINGSNETANKAENMFLLRDGTGIRNMTLVGLEGQLGALNEYLSRRPTAGAYASLDPGWGSNDNSAWVGTKSPYVQNVSTFGTACVGLKIDGNLHAGGNQTIVCNDFTQILSDGIGVWANGPGKTEAVSVFCYYNHIGYLSTQGGRIRGTNGNCSYGTYGAVSEGFNITEDPIQATVNNRYYEADVAQILCNNGNLIKFFYSNAGVNYSSGTFAISGAGINGSVEMDEFRDGAVYEARIADPGDSTAAGGLGYLFNTNASQGGNNISVVLAGSDTAEPEEYKEMRLILTQGTGTGQYGYIAEFDDTGKTAWIAKESKPTVTASVTTSSGNRITLSTTEELAVDDPIIFTGTVFGNIQNETVYYVKTIHNGTQITVSTSAGGLAYNLINATGTMIQHCLGWEHLIEGTPIETVLDSTSNYTIEARVTFSSPGFTSSAGTINVERQWTSITASPNKFVAVALDTNIAAYSANGTTWSNTTLPSLALWTKVKYVGSVYMAFASGGQAARSTDGITWTSMTMSSTAEWRDVTYGENKWVAIAGGGTKAAYSTDGITWIASTLPEGADWNAIEYGKGKFVTIAASDSSTGVAFAYSDNGTTWTAGSIPTGSIALSYGNGRFVALSGGYAGATEVSVSFDGVTWTEGTIQAADWRAIKYAQGLFIAVATGSAVVAVSKDGVLWEYQNIAASGPWCDITFGNMILPSKFLVIGGLTANSNLLRFIATGKQAQARAVVVAGRVSEIRIWEPGSGYTSAPVLSLTDPNASAEVTLGVRIGNGVIANPSIVNAGSAYATSSTRAIITGNGYKDQYQVGDEVIVENLTRIPGPGDALRFSSIDDYIYKLLDVTILGGTLGNYSARLQVAKALDRDEAPEHGTSIFIRQLYSQVRLTGHDFLDIGLGNFEQTNYPDTLNPEGTVPAPEDEIKENNTGRVFYTSTDQDGNFRVGELFAVEQSTGTVTLNADFFQFEGLEELQLGGVTVGGTGVVIREFSTDDTFTADSNNILPTQKAIRSYINSRVSGGGADAITGQLTAGVVRVGPDLITTTTGDELIILNRVNFKGGIDGDWLTQSFFMSAG